LKYLSIHLHRVLGRYLLSFEKCVKVEARKTAAKTGVRSKGHRQMLNGSGSRRGPVLIKKKMKIAAKTELNSSSHALDSAAAVDNGQDLVAEQLRSEFVPDAKKSPCAPSVAGADLKQPNVCQLDHTPASASTVRYGFISIGELTVNSYNVFCLCRNVGYLWS